MIFEIHNSISMHSESQLTDLQFIKKAIKYLDGCKKITKYTSLEHLSKQIRLRIYEGGKTLT